jgi:hypothetical protein
VHGDGCVAEVDYKADREVRQRGESRERGGGVARESVRKAEVCERRCPAREIRWCGSRWKLKLGDAETRRRCSRSGASRGTRLR